MWGCDPAETMRGVRMQAEQSSVGRGLWNWAMCPPIDGSPSPRRTRRPPRAGGRAVQRLQRLGVYHAPPAARQNGFGLVGRGLFVGVHPRDLLADRDQLA